MSTVSLSAEKLFFFLGIPITNTILTTLVVSLLLILFSFIFFKNPKSVPSFLQNIFESVTEGLIDLMAGVFDSHEKATKYFPFVATIFIFILISNWIGILPFLGLGAIGLNEVHYGQEVFVPLFRSAASDLNTTLAISLVTVISIQFFGIFAIGFFKYAQKFISFKDPISFFVGLLEIISEIAKIVSFSFRLFGNIFAGEVLLIVISFLVPLVAPLPFLLLEIFVGFIQALVFAMLTVVFISMATVDHH